MSTGYNFHRSAKQKVMSWNLILRRIPTEKADGNANCLSKIAIPLSSNAYDQSERRQENRRLLTHLRRVLR
jgi:hypothetical protein